MRLLPLSALLACLVATSTTLRPATPLTTVSAHHLHLEHVHSFVVSRPPAEAFVFFEPLGEKYWAKDWQPVFATDADAVLDNGTTFTVDQPRPDGSTLHSVWSIVQYDPPHRVEYQAVLAGLRATQIMVSCEAAAGNSTKVTVRYVYHGLSAEGDEFIAQITPEGFRDSIESWSSDIAAYLNRRAPSLLSCSRGETR